MIKQYKCHIVFILIIFFFYFIIYNSVFYFFFFFQAEDGIRDLYVTGVDVCSSDLAVWLAKVAERGMCRASLVHPKPIRELRNLTRYRRSLIRDRTREMQRVEKLLEDAQIKITSVVSDVFGVSGRAILHALINGQRDPAVLAGLAVGRLRPKTAQLAEALRGFFTDHHATILAMMLDNIDRLSAQITALDTTIAEAVDPFAHQVAQLGEITG